MSQTDPMADPAGSEEPDGLGWRPPPLGIAILLAVALVFVGAAGGYSYASRRPSPSTVDLGFVRDMRHHHEQAVQMSLLVLSDGAEPLVRHFATEIIVHQRYEIGLFDAWLAEWDHNAGDPARVGMAWMGRGLPLAEMPGMATQDQLKELQRLSGRDADALFLRLMIAHHRGGIDMARYAGAHGEDSRVRGLGAGIAKLQATEINELRDAQRRLSLPA